MRLLADTHALLWYGPKSERLSAKARRVIEESREPVWMSIASLWEMAIKVSIKKLDLGMAVSARAAEFRRAGFRLLPIGDAHLDRAATLPLHHRDPFDRMLIAQALTDGLTIVTADPAFDEYPVRTIW